MPLLVFGIQVGRAGFNTQSRQGYPHDILWLLVLGGHT